MSTVTVVVVRPSDALATGTHAGTGGLALARSEFRRRNGRLTRTPGGALRAVFDSASEAVAAVADVQASGGPELSVGIDLGEIVDDDDSLYSVADRVASTLAAQAGPGQILATGVVSALLSRRRDVEFRPVDDIAVEGLADAVPVVEVRSYGGRRDAPVRVIVADDASLIRSGIVQLLTTSGFEVVAEAADLEGLLAAVDADPPDLVVTDVRMPPTNTDEGLRAAVEIRERYPAIGILVLSQYIEVAAAAGLLTGREGGVGYLLKERVSDLDEFVDACRTVVASGSVIDPIVTEKLIAAGGHRETLERLSQRERDVLGLMAQGKSNVAIADELFVGAKTVETHVRSVFQKLELAETPEGNRRVQAVLEWLRAAPPPDS